MIPTALRNSEAFSWFGLLTSKRLSSQVIKA
jgi:hypothetical protein